MTRTIELPLPEELLQLVDEKARASGLPREVYIRAVLSKDVGNELSLSDIREQVSASGIADAELDHLFAEAREEAYRKRNPS
jgi:hypothetical protein